MAGDAGISTPLGNTNLTRLGTFRLTCRMTLQALLTINIGLLIRCRNSMGVVATDAAQCPLTLLKTSTHMHLLNMTNSSGGPRFDAFRLHKDGPDVRHVHARSKIKFSQAVFQHATLPRQMTLITHSIQSRVRKMARVDHGIRAGSRCLIQPLPGNMCFTRPVTSLTANGLFSK